MTRSRNANQPVSSFGPQLLAVLLKGARERVEIPCPDHRTMKWLQLRIQHLRGAMGREKHPQFPIVTRARTARTWDEKHGKDANCVLVVQPNDFQFDALIRAAGVEVTEHEQDLLDGIEPKLAPNEPIKFSIDEEIAHSHDPYAKFKGGGGG